MAISSLKNELEERLNKKIPDITHTINLLKTTQRIIKDQNDLNKIKLSDTEYDCAKNIFDYASLVEQEFKNSFQTRIAFSDLAVNDAKAFEEIPVILIALNVPSRLSRQ